jgi:hypothetical protein
MRMRPRAPIQVALACLIPKASLRLIAVLLEEILKVAAKISFE